MSQEWYYTVNGDRVGPVSAADLKRAATSGKITPSDLVWKDGMADWVEASTIKGLFSGSSTGTPAPEAAPADDERPTRKRESRRDEEGYREDDERPRKVARRNEDDYDDAPGSGRPRFNKAEVHSKKTTAALVGLLMGYFLGISGIQKFMLGRTVPGLILLFTCGGCGIVQLIDCIILLSKSDEDFYKEYIVGDKQWF